MRKLLLLLSCLSLSYCGDKGSPASPSSTPTKVTAPSGPPPLSVYGSVTRAVFVPNSGSSQYGNLNYEVTNHASRATSGCYIKVQWLDATGLQVDYSYAATNASLPAGESTVTDQNFIRKTLAAQIKNSRVSYSGCE